jgi:hypothetical protein
MFRVHAAARRMTLKLPTTHAALFVRAAACYLATAT